MSKKRPSRKSVMGVFRQTATASEGAVAAYIHLILVGFMFMKKYKILHNTFRENRPNHRLLHQRPNIIPY